MGESSVTRTNDDKAVVKFVKEYVFYQYGTPIALISDEGSHYCHLSFEALFESIL